MDVHRRLVGAWLTLLFVAGSAAATSSSAQAPHGDAPRAAKKAFKPKKLVGEWEGTHTNTTFGTSGPASATVVAPGRKFGLTLDLGGNVFGCGDPPEGPLNLLRKGSGPNTWNKKGFRVSTDTPALGQVEMNYKFKSKRITGAGKAPPCLPDITYDFTGTLTTKKMVLAIDIDLGGGQTAHTDFSVNKV